MLRCFPPTLFALSLTLPLVAKGATPTVYSTTGANGAAIQATLDSFRADLGANNGVGPLNPAGTPGVGRREINWDGVPDSFSSGGNPFPGNFFNLATGNPAGRVRGALFTTNGQFEVSADADSDNDGNPGPTAPLFANRHPDNDDDFAAFSLERIFGIVDSNQMDVIFSIPGIPGSPAAVRGFGAIFTDVETAGSTTLEFFDFAGNLLTTQNVAPFPFTGGDSGKSFSFLGVTFADPIVHRVHIIAGGYDLDLDLLDDTRPDAVAMDDFIYGEPKSVPEPSTFLFVGLAVACAFMRAKRASSR